MWYFPSLSFTVEFSSEQESKQISGLHFGSRVQLQFLLQNRQTLFYLIGGTTWLKLWCVGHAEKIIEDGEGMELWVWGFADFLIALQPSEESLRPNTYYTAS